MTAQPARITITYRYGTQIHRWVNIPGHDSDGAEECRRYLAGYLPGAVYVCHTVELVGEGEEYRYRPEVEAKRGGDGEIELRIPPDWTGSY